jgi:amidase
MSVAKYGGGLHRLINGCQKYFAEILSGRYRQPTLLTLPDGFIDDVEFRRRGGGARPFRGERHLHTGEKPAGEMRFRSAFVPHDISAPIAGASSGPLAGLTVAVKDMYDIAGYRTGGGNPQWLEAQSPASANASAVQKLLDAGATVVGKTVCDEFFYSVSGANAHYGTPVNPRAFGRLPGGSSSGSASAAASGACDFALGSDTGGSVRIPASFCGLYGLRPTHGRVDLTGAMAMAPMFDVCGWFSSVPSVFRKVGAALLGGAAVREPIRYVLVAEDAFAQADPEVVALLRGFLQAAAAALPKPRTNTLAPQGFDQWREIVRIVQAREVWKQYGPFIERHKPRLGPGIKERIEFASTVSENDAAALRAQIPRVREQIRSVVKPGTVVAMPAAPCIAPLTNMPPAEQESFRVRVMRLTCVSGISGLPQVSIPAGTISGCPIGISFLGWGGGDEALLDLAVSLAKYTGASLG